MAFPAGDSAFCCSEEGFWLAIKSLLGMPDNVVIADLRFNLSHSG
jgi:hypothetical protein